MRRPFVNREAELRELDLAARHGGLLVVYGRRRVGKTRLLRVRDHAATVFEDVCRTRYPGARRYWESNVELDLVAPDPDDPRRLLVAEVKWRRLSAAERQQVLGQLEAKWARCSLNARHPRVRFEVFDAGVLET